MKVDSCKVLHLEALRFCSRFFRHVERSEKKVQPQTILCKRSKTFARFSPSVFDVDETETFNEFGNRPVSRICLRGYSGSPDAVRNVSITFTMRHTTQRRAVGQVCEIIDREPQREQSMVAGTKAFVQESRSVCLQLTSQQAFLE